MPIPAGLASFPGVERIISARMTRGLGTSPGVGTIVFVPRQAFSGGPGEFKIGDGRETITCRDAIIDSVVAQRSGGGLTMTGRILDRRYAWRFCYISGRYNVRTADGRNVFVDTEKTCQELAELLFEALGESNADVSALPNDTRPAVDWVEASAANELDNLCGSLGCAVAYLLDESVKIVKLGTGQSLPGGGRVMSESVGINPAEKPDILRVVAGPTRYESALSLYAIGKSIGFAPADPRDDSGFLPPIDDLPYKPADGWEKESPELLLGTETAGLAEGLTLSLARESVFRWYRIAFISGFGGTNDPDWIVSLDESVDGVFGADERLILPLNRECTRTFSDVDDVPRSKPAEVWGSWYPAGQFGDYSDTSAGSIYRGSWSLDAERGIVMFSDPVTSYTSGEHSPASMYLRTSYGIRDKETRQPKRESRERRIGHGDKVRIIRRDDIYFSKWATYDESGNLTGSEDNTTEFNRECEFALDAAEAEYETVETAEKQYAGIIRIDCDGVRQQVSWSVGGSGATTQASANSEHNVRQLSMVERQRQERELKRRRDGGSPPAALLFDPQP